MFLCKKFQNTLVLDKGTACSFPIVEIKNFKWEESSKFGSKFSQFRMKQFVLACLDYFDLNEISRTSRLEAVRTAASSEKLLKNQICATNNVLLK